MYKKIWIFQLLQQSTDFILMEKKNITQNCKQLLERPTDCALEYGTIDDKVHLGKQQQIAFEYTTTKTSQGQH